MDKQTFKIKYKYLINYLLRELKTSNYGRKFLKMMGSYDVFVSFIFYTYESRFEGHIFTHLHYWVINNVYCPSYMLNEAFSWHCTDEGSDFWRDKYFLDK